MTLINRLIIVILYRPIKNHNKEKLICCVIKVKRLPSVMEIISTSDTTLNLSIYFNTCQRKTRKLKSVAAANQLKS